MKKRIKIFWLCIALITGLPLLAENLVILHTNDTHSHIDADRDGTVGILQRKALIDSVRNAEKNVLLVDAGDIVQGSLYFRFFKGDVEYPLMNLIDYDIQILGNHEFDNGIEDIAKYYKTLKATPLSANYDFSGTVLDGIFSPYTIKEIDGRKIGFMGINVDPESLIATENIGNMKFMEIIPVANETADFLKNKMGCDLVVAITHIGVDKVNEKTTDYDLARESKNIDIIIGGHSHTVINPGREGVYPSIVENADGEPVLVAQTGKYGRNLGYIKIDLDALDNASSKDFEYRLIPITERFGPEMLDQDIIEFLKPYKNLVDSVNSRVIATSAHHLSNNAKTGGFANFTADVAYNYAKHKADSLRCLNPSFPNIDFAIMNVGGQRLEMPAGDITEGQILTTYPFSNHLVIGNITGADLIETLGIAARKGGESISQNLLVVTHDDTTLPLVLLDGYEVDPEKTYTYATIDYLKSGNDDLKPLARGETLWRDEVEIVAPILRYVEHLGELQLPVDPDMRPRFIYPNR